MEARDDGSRTGSGATALWALVGVALLGVGAALIAFLGSGGEFSARPRHGVVTKEQQMSALLVSESLYLDPPSIPLVPYEQIQQLFFEEPWER